MKTKPGTVMLMIACLTACGVTGAEKSDVVIDKVTAAKVNSIILSEVIPSRGQSHGVVVSRVSSAFLGTPYQANTLIGGPEVPEKLVANFNGVDCFTLADYIEALTRSCDEKSFLQNLARTRYVKGNVSYLTRRHFFSDWSTTLPHNATDVTPQLSPNATFVVKHLNRSPDGGEYIKGLGIIPRKINYVPGKDIDDTVVSKLKNGDYVGIYSTLDGLDVSHVGIVVRHDGQVWFRNASSLPANRKVVDAPFIEYTHSKPGIMVLRAS